MLVGKDAIVVVYEEFEVTTGGRFDMLDITDEVRRVVASSGVRDGNVLVFSPHTTCSVMVGTNGHKTVAVLKEVMVVLAAPDGYYAHDDFDIRTENLVENEPANAPAHMFQVFAGRVSESLPVVDGRVILGEGQRIFFLELDSPRPRRYAVQVVGEGVSAGGNGSRP